MADEPDQRQGIQSVEVAMRVLEAIEGAGIPMTPGEIAARMGSQPSTVHRYLVSLVRVGLASRAPVSGRYDLGPAARRLGSEALRRTNEVAVASEHAVELRDATGHSVNISVWSPDGPLVARWEYGRFALPLTVRVGATLPLLASSAGIVFLASLPSTMTRPALERARAAHSSPVDDARIAAAVAAMHEDGVAVTTGGVIPGVSSVSAPAFSGSDNLPVCVSVVMPGQVLDAGETARVSERLLATTRLISADLGWIAAGPRHASTEG
jgi:DNA-binding IclR family transcriptional regulator